MLNKKKSASATVYLIAFFVIFLAFAAFAVDGTIVWTNRLKLQNATESTALAAAAEFNSGSNAAAIETYARDTFAFLKHDSLEAVNVNDTNNLKVVADKTNNKVCVTSNMASQTYFLAFLGVSKIDLTANACAISEELNVTANYSGVNWVTASAAYLSDILSKNLNYNDTAILKPIGNLIKSASYDTSTDFVKFELINKDNTSPLSLGAGGFITIKLPAPIVDKPGNDLYIKESGDSSEGYMVFVGIDNDPANPYVKSGQEGGGITWVNISAAGNGIENSTASTSSLGNQDKIYGSAYFDIGGLNLSMAKYIRIVDDNEESAYINGQKVNIYGEASTATPGADIDYVTVLNHVRLTTGS